MNEPFAHFRWWNEQMSPVKISTADVLMLSLGERAYPPRPPTEKSFRNLDALKSQIRQGRVGVILGF